MALAHQPISSMASLLVLPCSRVQALGQRNGERACRPRHLVHDVGALGAG